MDKIENIRGEIHSVTTLHEMMVRLIAEGKEQGLIRHDANEHRLTDLTKRVEVILHRMTNFDDSSGKLMVDLYTIQSRFEDAVKVNDQRWALVDGRNNTIVAAVHANTQEISRLTVKADEAIQRGKERLDNSVVQINSMLNQISANMTAIARLTSEAESSRKAMDVAFLTSEKAIEKSEIAQREYNNRSNEFRGQLDDQAKRLMPREETMTMFKASEDKVSSFSAQVHTRLDGVANQFEARLSALAKELDQLKAKDSLDQGKAQGAANTGRVIMASVGLLATLIAICTGVLVLISRWPS